VIEDSVKEEESVDRIIFLGFEGSVAEEELRRIIKVVIEKHKPERR
jgi:hypothetical protein